MATLSIPRRKPASNPVADNRQARNTQGTLQPDSNTPARNLPGSAPVAGEQNTHFRNGKGVRKQRAVYYPTGDGKPMAEDRLHLNQMNYTIPALRYRYRDRPDVFVGGNDFVYYEEGNPRARVSPDCYVAFGVEPKDRRFYKVWEEQGIAPSVVFEFTSKKTKKEDVRVKTPLYEQVLGVQEYFQFDPGGEYLTPRLQGQRLQNGVYQAIDLENDRMTSEQLGLELVIEGDSLRFYDPATGEWLRTYEEAENQRVAQEQRAEAERQRAEAQARLAATERQRAQVEAQRAQVEAQRAQVEAQRAEREALRAEEEAQRAEAADRRADREAQRAEAAEAELARMRQEFEALRQQK